MKKIEYKFVTLNLNEVNFGLQNVAGLEEEANKLGAEGWLLSHVHQGSVAVFVREAEKKL